MHTIKDLGPLTHPMAVNDAGQVVGYADIDITGHIHHAFFWDSGNLINLDDNWPPHTEAAFSVNKDGQVVGSTALISDLTPSTGLLAFFCGEPLANNPTLLPLDKVTSIARGINKLSAIVGHRQLPGERWQPDLPRVSSELCVGCQRQWPGGGKRQAQRGGNLRARRG